ncbi:hypothetical protein ADUPG1_012414, partial [Aduncisulcus paluster]
MLETNIIPIFVSVTCSRDYPLLIGSFCDWNINQALHPIAGLSQKNTFFYVLECDVKECLELASYVSGAACPCTSTISLPYLNDGERRTLNSSIVIGLPRDEDDSSSSESDSSSSGSESSSSESSSSSSDASETLFPAVFFNISPVLLTKPTFNVIKAVYLGPSSSSSDIAHLQKKW